MQWQEGFREAGESACCSVKKAFSSMVFIIRELHSYTLQIREILFFEDLQGILSRVQKEMQTSFVWLFQQVFSRTKGSDFGSCKGSWAWLGSPRGHSSFDHRPPYGCAPSSNSPNSAASALQAP
ncbi:uncharacterized protein LOC125472915 [Pyrus x bretschneideri]|uniref:uncharacterized protein LOC125472915 n=1 Tax=Pyrus x bretschneideri TaxID=225117 RepID=UPI00202FDD53|nr:uncharacterized protein LOC125472915 [Pyrus x bretschneideri]